MALRNCPVTRLGWAAYYDQRAAKQGPGSHACILATWLLLLQEAFGD